MATKKQTAVTNKELLQLKYLRREIINDTQQLIGLRAQVREGAGYRRTDKTEADILKCERRLERKLKKSTALERRLLRFIDNIDDCLARQVFYYRYVKCMSWTAVAMKVGGYNSPDSVRKIAERYLKKIQTECENG